MIFLFIKAIIFFWQITYFWQLSLILTNGTFLTAVMIFNMWLIFYSKFGCRNFPKVSSSLKKLPQSVWYWNPGHYFVFEFIFLQFKKKINLVELSSGTKICTGYFKFEIFKNSLCLKLSCFEKIKYISILCLKKSWNLQRILQAHPLLGVGCSTTNNICCQIVTRQADLFGPPSLQYGKNIPGYLPLSMAV